MALKGLDEQIRNTLVGLSETFDELEKQVKSQRPADLEYYLTRMKTLAKDGLTDVNKAIDITKGVKFEGAGLADDVIRPLKHASQILTKFFHWIGEKLGFCKEHNTEIKAALNKSAGILAGKPIDQLKNHRDGVGIHFGETGHRLDQKMQGLLHPEEDSKHHPAPKKHN